MRQPLVDELYKLVESRVKNHACPCCGETDWVRPNDRVLALIKGHVRDGRGPELVWPPEAEVVLTFICRQCGFIRGHFHTLPS